MKAPILSVGFACSLLLFSGCIKTKTISTDLHYNVIVDGIAYNLVYGKSQAYVTGKQAILNAAQKLCQNGQVNIGIGNPDKWENIFTNQGVNYLTVNPGRRLLSN